MPVRIQRRRTRGWRMPPNAVSVTRPGRFGNPYAVGDTYAWLPGRTGHPDPMDPAIVDYTGILTETARDAATVTAWFRSWISVPTGQAHPISLAVAHQDIWRGLPELAGRDLACWCPIGQPCHADVLLDIANGDA